MKVNGSTGVLGIFGNPIEHTFSPDIHNMLSTELGINEMYVPFKVESDIEAAVKGAFAMNVQGLNVTVPHKQAVMEHLAEIDENAAEIGAVNTLVRLENSYKGYNTDMMGLKRAVESAGVSLSGKDIVVLGAGGASRAVVYMCLISGASKVYLVNRTYEKAVSLAESMNELFAKKETENGEVIPVAAADYKSIPEGSYIMFQCTSLGLKGNNSLLIEDDEFYEMAEYGYDLVYNPAVTPFVFKLKNSKIPVDNGITMLLYQAIIAYELWNDIKISDELAEKVLTMLKKKVYGDNIVLVGYMGSGKTTVGKYIAEKYKMKFVDTDEYIEENEGISIPDIFKGMGEKGFRKMETAALKNLLNTTYNTVVSTGGGIVITEGNIELLSQIGKVYFLNASPAEIYERVKGDTGRPLLQANSPEEVKKKIETMLDTRMPYYSNAADEIVSVDGKSVDHIAKEIMKIN